LIRIELGPVFNINDYDELARMFLPRGEYELVYAKAYKFEGVPVKLEKWREIYNTLFFRNWISCRGMAPYYLYGQKQTVGNLENIGYACEGTECVYNMRMMQERQTVIALGAGAVSKVYYRDEDRIERAFNIADTGLYIARIQEMIERKRRLFEEI